VTDLAIGLRTERLEQRGYRSANRENIHACPSPDCGGSSPHPGSAAPIAFREAASPPKVVHVLTESSSRRRKLDSPIGSFRRVDG
jgi:hypothetical protein